METTNQSQFKSIQEENFEESIPHSKKQSISESMEIGHQMNNKQSIYQQTMQ